MNKSRSASKAIEHIALAEGDWVDLRILNFGDRQAIMAALIDPDSGERSVATRLPEANATELVRAIVAWGGPGFGCTCAGGGRCEAPTPAHGQPHANDCHAWPINTEAVKGLDETGDVLLRLVGAKAVAASEGDPFILSRSTSPTSAGAAVETPNSRPSSTSGPSSASGTSTPEPRSD